MLNDAGQLPASSISPGSGSQQNSQCSLNGANSSASLAGQVLTLNLSLSFLPAFGGGKSVYLQAVSPWGSTPWQTKGSWTVTFAATAVSVVPALGGGNQQRFSFQFSDEAGASDLSTVSVFLNGSAATAAACSVTYDRARNTLSLLNDAGQVTATSISPGSGSLQNSQCALNGAGSSEVWADRL